MFRARYEEWWRDHAGARAEWLRRDLLPRVEQQRPLHGLRVLDFGCGTGSSSIVFAESGATVVGVEPDETSIAVAHVRVRDCGFDDRVELRQIPYLSGGDEELALESGSFDLVSLIGVIEHMLPSERGHCLREARRLLKPGGELFIYDTPNRLFPYDGHTANLWLSTWMPTPLARRYAIWRGRMGADSEFLRRGGVGVSRRTLERLVDRTQFRQVYEKSASDVRVEFLRTARRLPFVGRVQPKVAKAVMLGGFWVLVRGSGLLGVPASHWTDSHALTYVKT
jgi:SAM-dependent methyltransferase